MFVLFLYLCRCWHTPHAQQRTGRPSACCCVCLWPDFESTNEPCSIHTMCDMSYHSMYDCVTCAACLMCNCILGEDGDNCKGSFYALAWRHGFLLPLSQRASHRLITLRVLSVRPVMVMVLCFVSQSLVHLRCVFEAVLCTVMAYGVSARHTVLKWAAA
jgi:hypothetical protein